MNIAHKVQRAKLGEKKTFSTISSHRVLFYTIKNIYKFFNFFDHLDWKIVAIEMKRIIIFRPFFIGLAHFDSPKAEIFAVPTFIFLKRLWEKYCHLLEY